MADSRWLGQVPAVVCSPPTFAEVLPTTRPALSASVFWFGSGYSSLSVFAFCGFSYL